jgi:hypothetical protein
MICKLCETNFYHNNFIQIFNSKQKINLIAKLLKNVEDFREDANLDEMTINELAFYSEILPFYENFLKDVKGFDTNWTPKFYYGFYGFEKGL